MYVHTFFLESPVLATYGIGNEKVRFREILISFAIKSIILLQTAWYVEVFWRELYESPSKNRSAERRILFADFRKLGGIVLASRRGPEPKNVDFLSLDAKRSWINYWRESQMAISGRAKGLIVSGSVSWNPAK